MAMILLLLLSLLFPLTSASNEEGLQFLKENKLKPGVIELPSGLQYKVLQKGSGAMHPKVSTPCSCHYEGKLIDGTVFDSSYERGSPTTFAPNQVIKGWTEAMQLMVQGDKYELYIPSELAYGERGSPPKIPPGSVLIFQMEILELLGEGVPALLCDAKTKSDCNDKEVGFIDKALAWTEDKVASELERLDRLSKDQHLKADLKEWMLRRQRILQQLVVKEEL